MGKIICIEVNYENNYHELRYSFSTKKLYKLNRDLIIIYILLLLFITIHYLKKYLFKISAQYWIVI